MISDLVNLVCPWRRARWIRRELAARRVRRKNLDAKLRHYIVARCFGYLIVNVGMWHQAFRVGRRGLLVAVTPEYASRRAVLAALAKMLDEAGRVQKSKENCSCHNQNSNENGAGS